MTKEFLPQFSRNWLLRYFSPKFLKIETSKTITFNGVMVDPVTGKEKKVKEIITYIDDNTQKMEMFDIDANGKEFKNMEINSKRRK